MLTLARRFFRRRALRAKVVRALSTGVGIYETSFLWPASQRDTLAPQIVDWCRDMMGRTDRPYGLDQVTLALSLEALDGTRNASVTLPALRPTDFYDGGNALPDVESAVREWQELPDPEHGRVRAVLFSWGDLARELLPAG